MQKKKAILLTGASGLVGMKLLEELINDDYRVIFTSRSQSTIQKIEKLFNSSDDIKAIGLECNLEDIHSLGQIKELLQKENIVPYALINNARNADYLKIQNDGLISESNWLGEFMLAVIVPYRLSMLFSEFNFDTSRKIINIASMYGVVAPNLSLYDNPKMESPVNYGTCKAALIHLTKELAVRLAHKNIQVNSISYGGIEGRVNDQFILRYKKLSPQNRMLQLDDIYAPVKFLLSEHCTAMTGQNLCYDGGWTIW